MKKHPLLFLCICCFIYALLRYPTPLVHAGATCVSLFLTGVLPSLFPFMIACGLLLRMGVAEELGYLLSPLMYPLFRLPGIAAFPFFLGIFSGYPLGAKITASLYQEGKISLQDAEHILTFSNNPGPLFLVGTVATTFFGVPFWGYILLFCCFLGALTTGILLGLTKPPTYKTVKSHHIPSIRFSLVEALPQTLMDSLNTVVQIGGYILLFGVIVEAMTQLGIFQCLSDILYALPLSPVFLQGLGGGFLEMTNGASLLSTAPEPLRLRLSATCFLVAFGGLSILGQTYGILKSIPIKKTRYFCAKLMNGFLSSIIFYMSYPFLEKYAQKAVPVFSTFITETAFSAPFSIQLSFLFLVCTCMYGLCRK